MEQKPEEKQKQEKTSKPSEKPQYNEWQLKGIKNLMEVDGYTQKEAEELIHYT